jgi:hypothetical protein
MISEQDGADPKPLTHVSNSGCGVSKPLNLVVKNPEIKCEETDRNCETQMCKPRCPSRGVYLGFYVNTCKIQGKSATITDSSKPGPTLPKEVQLEVQREVQLGVLTPISVGS